MDINLDELPEQVLKALVLGGPWGINIEFYDYTSNEWIKTNHPRIGNLLRYVGIFQCEVIKYPTYDRWSFTQQTNIERNTYAIRLEEETMERLEAHIQDIANCASKALDRQRLNPPTQRYP